MKQIAVVGAGASGLVVSGVLAKRGFHVDLYEKNADIGKKILASGNGRCNISNQHISVRDYYGNFFVEPTLKQFSYQDLVNFFASIGLVITHVEDGRAYPLTNEAKSVVRVLKRFIQDAGVNLFVDHAITAIERENEIFVINQQYYDSVIITTGLGAAPQLGATEDGLHIAQQFSIPIIPTYPSLVGLEVNSNYHHKMAGLKREVELTLLINGQKEQSVYGDLLFTKYGLSGLAVLDISHEASQALAMHQAVDVRINFFPQLSRQALADQIFALQKAVNSNDLHTVLEGLLPTKMIPHINIEILNKKTVKTVVNQLQQWSFEIRETNGFSHAEVSGGGIDVQAIDPKTMMVKDIPELYFGGEVLDVTGRRGGFNFHFAFGSAFMIAKAIKNR
jgi:predicted Rossmann fold flavoprotein